MIFSRLKEERERLGLTQPGLGELVGAAKRTVIDWEKGVSSPTAVQMATFAEAGMDVGYVLLGKALPERVAEAAAGLPSRLRALREEQGLEAVLRVAGVTAKQWQSFEESDGPPKLPPGTLQRLIAGLNIDASSLLLGQFQPLTTTRTEETLLLQNYRVCSPSDQETIRQQAHFLARREIHLAPDGRYPNQVDASVPALHGKTRRSGPSSSK